MILLRKLLFPFAILYGFITSLRNYLYDNGVFKSYSFETPIIAVGNLSVGGTGKTPQIEYLIRLLSPHYKVATLSRGYKRKSKGFILANKNSDASLLGDESYQFFTKFPTIQVAVDVDRCHGIKQLLGQSTPPEVVLLDDAFQHRKVKAGFYILLSSYDDLYYDDFMLPTGNLREYSCGAQRADVIIITKCPTTISAEEQNAIKEKIGLQIPIFFSNIAYDDKVYNDSESLLVNQIKSKSKLLVAGIAKPQPFIDYLLSDADDFILFPDHHHFTATDIRTLENKSKSKIIITTEKDFVRLKAKNLNTPLYYLPIKSQLVSDQETFNQIILNYVGTHSRNRNLH